MDCDHKTSQQYLVLGTSCKASPKPWFDANQTFHNKMKHPVDFVSKDPAKLIVFKKSLRANAFMQNNPKLTGWRELVSPHDSRTQDCRSNIFCLEPAAQWTKTDSCFSNFVGSVTIGTDLNFTDLTVPNWSWLDSVASNQYSKESVSVYEQVRGLTRNQCFMKRADQPAHMSGRQLVIVLHKCLTIKAFLENNSSDRVLQNKLQ